jgi:DNA-binding transcriptional regulator PaaX
MSTPKKPRYYKGIKVNSFGFPQAGKSEKKEGKVRVRDVYNFSFPSPFQDNSPKNLVVMYDIPHDKKKERDWFRRTLKKFGYIMIQKSVWVGPSPLPKDFLDYVTTLGILKQLKTLKLAKPYAEKSTNL